MKIERKESYLSHIEGLRALAAIMVMLFHFITFQNPAGYIIDSGTTRYWAGFGAQGVELFYVISGCVIALSFQKTGYSYSDFPRYLLKRFLRILPSYYALIALICMNAVFLWGWPCPYTLKQLFLNATFTVDLFPGEQWLNVIFITLKVEFQFYIIIGLIYPLLKRYTWIPFVLLPGLFVLEDFYFEIDILHNVPFFAIGLLAAELIMRPDRKITWLYIALCMVGMLVNFRPGLANYWTEDFVIVIAGLVFILLLKIRAKWLEFAGKFSYSLYLLHGFIGGTFLFIIDRNNYAQEHPVIAIATAVLLSLTGAYLFYLVVEKRSLNWTRRIRYKRD